MIVRTLEECRQSERRVVAENWESVRMLLKDDHMGFSFISRPSTPTLRRIFTTATTSNRCTACRVKAKLRLWVVKRIRSNQEPCTS